MSVRSIDNEGDWRFGRGKADYLTGSKEIQQNVVTRLRSFTDDFFLDVENGNPWIELFGNLGTDRRIIRQVEKSILTTNGVVSVTSIELISKDLNREAKIEVSYNDVFNENILAEVSI